MRFCPNCGRQFDDQAIVCPSCGRNVSNNNPQTAGFAPPGGAPNPGYPPQFAPNPINANSDHAINGYQSPASPYDPAPDFAPGAAPYDPVPPYNPAGAQYDPMGATVDPGFAVYQSPQPPEQTHSNKSKGIVIVIMAIIVVILIGVTLFLVLHGKNNNSEDSSKEETTTTVESKRTKAEKTTTSSDAVTTQNGVTVVTVPTTATMNVPTMTSAPAAAPTAPPQVSVPATVPTTLPPQTAPTPPPPYTPQQTEDTELIVNLNTAAGSGTILNIRSGPGMNYPVIDQIQNGARVHRLAQSGNWSYIDFGTGRGWCDSSVARFVSAGSSSGETVVVRLNQAAGSGPILNVRSGPGRGYDVIAQIPDGSVVTRYSQENGWSYINYGSGYGWVNTSVAGF